MKWMEHVAHMGAMRNLYKIYVGKPEGKNRSVWETVKMGRLY
jgi:hypothetical protein